jgi:hypothetical protein
MAWQSSMEASFTPPSTSPLPLVLPSRPVPGHSQTSFQSVLGIDVSSGPMGPNEDLTIPQFVPFPHGSSIHRKLSQSHQVLPALPPNGTLRDLARRRRDSIGLFVTPGGAEHYRRETHEIGPKPTISYQRPGIGRRDVAKEN